MFPPSNSLGLGNPSRPSLTDDTLTLTTTTNADNDLSISLQPPTSNPLKSFIHRRRHTSSQGHKRPHHSIGSHKTPSHPEDLFTFSDDSYEQDHETQEQEHQPITKRARSPRDVPFRPQSEPTFSPTHPEQEAEYKKTDSSPEPGPITGGVVQRTKPHDLSFTDSITAEQLRQMNEGIGLDDDDDDDHDPQQEEPDTNNHIYRPQAAGRQQYDLPITPPHPRFPIRLPFPIRPHPHNDDPFPLQPHPHNDDTYPSTPSTSTTPVSTLTDILSLDTSPTSMQKRLHFFRTCTSTQWSQHGQALLTAHQDIITKMMQARESRARVFAQFERELDERAVLVDDRLQKSKAYMARLRNSFGLLL